MAAFDGHGVILECDVVEWPALDWRARRSANCKPNGGPEITARVTLVLAALAMFAAVALGAFGAHGLRGRLDPEMIGVWQTAVQYHAWHALALLGTGILLLHWRESRGLKATAWLFAAGIVLFSGSLYALAFTGLRTLGIVTPIGGVLFLAGWAVLTWTVWRREG
jgi:uncharacterized membrane protein YgdD (TMEM256/DUF423 family)